MLEKFSNITKEDEHLQMLFAFKTNIFQGGHLLMTVIFICKFTQQLA